MIAKPVWVNANTALNYHTESEDNYYQQEGDLGEWQGTIANQLELGKTITKETLEHMLWGKNPYTGEDLVHGKFNEKGDRIRAGLDLTFTPPKSLSVVYEIAKEKGNEKIAQTLLKLHNDAVEATLQRIEERYSRTRLTINGNTKKIDSQGLAIAKFTHDVARPVEIDGKVIVAPNLHTHALIMNITKDKNGNFKAIESEDIFKNYMAQGMTYRSLLAQGLQENGFEILITDSNKGFFELKNIPSEVNEAMSPRSIQIEEAVKELRKEFPNMALGELKQMATYKTRNWKGKIDRTQVRTQNVKIMEEIGLDTKALLSSFQLEKNIKKFSLNTNDYLDNAIKAITEEKSVFKKEDIETIAYKMGLQDGISIREIERAWQEKRIGKEKNSLINLGNGNWATREFLQIERFIVNFTNNTKNTLQPIMNRQKAKLHVKKYSDELKEKTSFGMTKGQKESAELILSSKDQIIGIQGDAGTGKTTMLKAVNQILGSEILLGLSYTGKAASEIERATASKDRFEDAGIKSMTIAKFLHNTKKMPKDEKEKYQGKKLIVDEASMLSTRDAQKLFNFAKDSGVQLVLIGDTKQFSAISAGSPFRLLQENGMKTIKMEEVLRQKNKVLQDAVKHLNTYSSQRNKRALDLLKEKNMIKEIGSYEIDGEKIRDKELFKEESINEMVNLYFNAENEPDILVSTKDTFSQLILTNTNEIKDTLNERIREVAKEKKMIDKEEKITQVLEPVRLSPSKKYFAENYKVGQVVELADQITHMKDYDRNSIRIKSVNNEKNNITIEYKKRNNMEVGDSIQNLEIDLKEEGYKLNTFELKEKKFAIGDKIVFEKNENTKLHVKNGEIGIITNVKNNILQITKDNGTEVEVDTNEYKYLNYGYALTTHKSQGQTSDKVYAFMDSSIQDYKSLYVTITRAVHDLKIWTDDYENLLITTSRENEKDNAIEKKTQEEIESLLNQGNLTRIQNLILENNIKTDSIEKVIKEYQDKQFFDFKRNDMEVEENDLFLQKIETKREQISFNLSKEKIEKIYEKINEMIPGQTNDSYEKQHIRDI